VRYGVSLGPPGSGPGVRIEFTPDRDPTTIAVSVGNVNFWVRSAATAGTSAKTRFPSEFPRGSEAAHAAYAWLLHRAGAQPLVLFVRDDIRTFSRSSFSISSATL